MIDAGVAGNEARFINHSCDPNCETVIEGGRVFIEAVRTIQPGEELGYEYGLTWESTDDPDELARYACRCGAAKCRGTMLDEKPIDAKPVRKPPASRAAQPRSRPVARTPRSAHGGDATSRSSSPRTSAAASATPVGCPGTCQRTSSASRRSRWASRS